MTMEEAGGVADSEVNPEHQGGSENEIVNVPDDEETPGNYPSTDKGNPEDVDQLPCEKSHQKPPYSYAQLIVQALLASKDRKQTLSNIYAFISEKYPHYKLEDKGWKVKTIEWLRLWVQSMIHVLALHVKVKSVIFLLMWQ